ncbi:MAG: glycosyltransferase family 9 protein [Planctomycetes bacterium]|nr:glycosyltransferase family 9 protein [Planctomycetota bacterium]
MRFGRDEGADYTLTIRMSRRISRILLVKPSALGDVCRSMPALASLRAAFPQAEIDWFVQDDFADAVCAHPALHAVVPFPRRAWRRWWTPDAVRGVLGLRRQIREASYDLVLDLQGLLRSAIFAQAATGARRVAWRDAREGSGWLANERHARRGGPDATEVMLALLEDAGVPAVRDPRMHVPETAREAWRARRDASGVDRYVALAPTSRWSAKRWPAERWKTLAERLVSRGMRIVMLGAGSERDQVRACMPKEGVVDLCGALSLGAWLAAIEGADAVVANDSAATHAAVGLGRPLVAIYGATDPSAVGPFGQPECVVAPPGPAPTDPHGYRDPRMVQRMRLIGVDAVERRLHEEIQRGPRW